LEESVSRYLSQLDTADRQEPSETLTLKKVRIKEKLEKLRSEMDKLAAIEKQVLAAPDQQIALTDPDSRSMATSGRGSGVVGYNVQTAVDTEHHLIVAHEVTNVGNDTAHLSNIAYQAKAALGVEKLEAVADRGYFDGEEILACDQADITVTLPKPQRSGAKSEGRFGKQDFVYLASVCRLAQISLSGSGRTHALPGAAFLFSPQVDQPAPTVTDCGRLARAHPKFKSASLPVNGRVAAATQRTVVEA
jgi:hypothetical protein